MVYMYLVAPNVKHAQNSLPLLSVGFGRGGGYSVFKVRD